MKKIFMPFLICILFLSGCQLGNIKISIDTNPTPTPTLSPMIEVTPSPTPTPEPTPSPTPTPKPYTYEERIAAKGILSLLKELKNPDSLQVHRITYIYDENKVIQVLIDCSAQNGFGGMNRTVYLVTTSNEFASLGWEDASLGVTVFENTLGDIFMDINTPINVERVMELVNR